MTPATPTLTEAALAAQLADPAGREALAYPLNAAGAVIVTNMVTGTEAIDRAEVTGPAAVVTAVVPPGSPAPGLADVCVHTIEAAQHVAARVAERPLAATTLTQLLRITERVDVAAGLTAESLAYSTLQHGSEFETWLAGHHRRPIVESGEPLILATATDTRLELTLNRPARRNAWSTGMRDALCDLLTVALMDRRLATITLDGNGPAFCAGGDLDEFGEARDAALAHVTRTNRSAAALVHELKDRIVCRLHGACIGAGIELPAFAGHVVADAGTFFQLPEVGMGLVPGAGGTVSITRRVGRWRCAWLALTGERLDAATALEWGLIDELQQA